MSEVSVNDFRRMEREFKEAKQHNAQLRVELEASVDKLHVYRQTQASRMLPVASDITGVAGRTLMTKIQLRPKNMLKFDYLLQG